MSKDKIYRTVGVLFMIISVILLIVIPDLTKIEAVLLGVSLGSGVILFSSGENIKFF